VVQIETRPPEQQIPSGVAACASPAKCGGV
jgi:hypothetical protein